MKNGNHHYGEKPDKKKKKGKKERERGKPDSKKLMNPPWVTDTRHGSGAAVNFHSNLSPKSILQYLEATCMLACMRICMHYLV